SSPPRRTSSPSSSSPCPPSGCGCPRPTACRTGRDRASDRRRRRLGGTARRGPRGHDARLRPLLGVPGRRRRPGRRRAHGVRLQRRERLVRTRPVRRVRPGLGVAPHRRRPAHPLHLRGRQRRHPRPVRPLPPAAVRVRRRRTAGGDPGGNPAAVGDAAPGLRPAAPHPVTPVRPLRATAGTAGTVGRRGRALRTPEGTSAMAMDAISVIRTKRDRGELSDEQIDWVIDAYTRGEVADEQMSALAMAILLNGMNRGEIARWTAAMIASGERMDFSSLSRPTADKHSTGGVGDKITLPLAPLVAACGAAVPQLSGRGLGHTGGTLDKLESIPGWRALLSNEEMLHVLDTTGAVICAAGDGLAPADKKLYALRDVTGTVEAIPLIASSIMSKKLAEGSGSLVLDVKVGTGAFMTTLDDARELARTMVGLGTDSGVKTVALLTDMSTPLGLTAGNALEVRESVEVLAGGGPADVVELTLALA